MWQNFFSRLVPAPDPPYHQPARSCNGALVKLRVAAEHYRLMGEIEYDPYARLTYQAWQSLETKRVAAGMERLAKEARALPSPDAN